jgi:DNA-binding MarR family transcriptional regulator
MKKESNTSVEPEAKLMLDIIGAFRDIAPHMQAQAMQTFLVVAGKPGMSFSEIAEKVRFSTSSASRNIGRLSDGFGGKNGFHLLSTFQDGSDARIRRATLSKRGLELASRIESIMQRD